MRTPNVITARAGLLKKHVFLAALFFLSILPAAARQKEKQPDFAAYVMARHALVEQNAPLAARYLDRALTADPKNPALLREGLAMAITTGDFSQAVSRARALEESGEPERATTSMILAIEALREEKYQKALPLFDRLEGSTFDALIRPAGKAWALEGDGKTDEALAVLDSLRDLNLFREYKETHRAYILDHAGRKDEAEKAYNALIGNAALRSFQPLGAYVGLLLREGRKDAARDLLDNFQKRFPDRDYIRALKIESERGGKIGSPAASPAAGLSAAMLRLGEELGREGANALALTYVRMAGFLAPESGAAQLLAGDILTEMRDYQLARAAYARAETDPSGKYAARLRAAAALDQSGDTDGAIAELSALLSGKPDDAPDKADIFSMLGDFERKRERFDKAAAWYDKSIAHLDKPGQKDWFLFFARGIAYERLKDWAKAEQSLTKALELQPDEPQVMNYLGYSWIDRGINKDRARTLIERAVAARPNDGFIIDSWGWILFLERQFPQAVEQLERAVLLEPGDPTLNEHLGDAYWRIGREREARFQWSHALAFDPVPDQAAGLKMKIDKGLPPLAPEKNAARP